jgi:DNA mismatch repair protein MutL
VALLQLPPADVDVNIHPTKAEVRFREPEVAFSAVQKAVRGALLASAPIPEVQRPFADTPIPPGSVGAWTPARWSAGDDTSPAGAPAAAGPQPAGATFPPPASPFPSPRKRRAWTPGWPPTNCPSCG